MASRFPTDETRLVNNVLVLSDRLAGQMHELSPAKSSKRMIMLGGGMQMKVPGSASQDMHPSSCVLRVVYSETYGESR